MDSVVPEEPEKSTAHGKARCKVNLMRVCWANNRSLGGEVIGAGGFAGLLGTAGLRRLRFGGEALAASAAANLVGVNEVECRSEAGIDIIQR